METFRKYFRAHWVLMVILEDVSELFKNIKPFLTHTDTDRHTRAHTHTHAHTHTRKADILTSARFKRPGKTFESCR